MSPQMIQTRLGLGACCVALFLGLVGIPNWVSSPSNVGNIVLSPTFWPYVLSVLTGLIGLGLLVAGRRATAFTAADEKSVNKGRAWGRLIALAAIMVVTMFSLPRLGMVWTAMAVLMITALLFRTRHPIVALGCAVVIPLALYLFFAHVAGIAIPQGNFVRLP